MVDSVPEVADGGQGFPLAVGQRPPGVLGAAFHCLREASPTRPCLPKSRPQERVCAQEMGPSV